MSDALSAVVQTMSADAARLAVLAQNLANVSTAGFKQDVPVSRGFSLQLSQAAGADQAGATYGGDQIYAAGASLLQTVIDFKPGALRSTGNPFDLAIEGKGFFEVRDDAGAAYTRQGSFRLDVNGKLVTESGQAVQGQGGDIVIPSGRASIDKQGRVLENDKLIGQLRIISFDNRVNLTRSGNGLFVADGQPSGQADPAMAVRQGFLEASNVSSAKEMIRMIETMRHFETGQKVVQAYDAMLDRVMSKLGEF